LGIGAESGGEIESEWKDAFRRCDQRAGALDQNPPLVGNEVGDVFDTRERRWSRT
jgi:hypothetical protein